MSLKINYLFIASLLSASVFSISALAKGGGSDGGGNAVACFSTKAVRDVVRAAGFADDDQIKQITSIETYDLYETRLNNGPNSPQLIQPKNPSDYKDYTKQIADRFSLYVPIITNTLNDESAFLDIRSTGALKNIDDTARLLEIGNPLCTIVTMAAQERVGSHTTLYIDMRLFNHSKHSAWSRAALYLHEKIYKWARENDQKNSRNTRILFENLISKSDKLTIGLTQSLIHDLGFFEYSRINDSPLKTLTLSLLKNVYATASYAYWTPLKPWPDTTLLTDAQAFLLANTQNNDYRKYIMEGDCGLAHTFETPLPHVIVGQLTACRAVLETDDLLKAVGLILPLSPPTETARQRLILQIKSYEGLVPPVIKTATQAYSAGAMSHQFQQNDIPLRIADQISQTIANFASVELPQWPIRLSCFFRYGSIYLHGQAHYFWYGNGIPDFSDTADGMLSPLVIP